MPLETEKFFLNKNKTKQVRGAAQICSWDRRIIHSCTDI